MLLDGFQSSASCECNWRCFLQCGCISVAQGIRHSPFGFSLPLAFSLLGFFGSPLKAGGFYSPYHSATAIGTAFAGASARADDAGFFLYNPAIISSLGGAQTWIDARAFFPNAEIDPDEAINALGAGIARDGDTGNLARAALAVGSVSVYPIAPGLTLGIGSAAPFATDVETDPGWAGRYHLIRARMVGLNAEAALSWQATPELALAAGVQVQRFDARFANAAILPTSRGLVEGIATLEGEPSWATGAVAGLVWTPLDGTRIGIGWRSAMTHEIEGQAETTVRGFPVEKLSFDLDLPHVVSAGLDHRLTADLRFFAEAQWVGWRRFKGFDIAFESGRPNEVRPIEWRDTWLLAVGAGIKLAPATEVTAGLSYDTAAAIDASGTTISTDAGKWMVGLGLMHEVEGLGRLSFSYAHILVEDAHVFADNPSSGTIDGSLGGRMDVLSGSVTIPW